MPLILVPVVMYLVWRLWLHLRGQKWAAKARWESRLTASYDYADTLAPMTREQKIIGLATALVTLTVIAAAAFLIIRSN
jgi:hypothetical protein